MRRRITLLATGLVLALPASALAQSAGDDQYTDPFADEDPPAQQQEPPADAPAQAPSSAGDETAPAESDTAAEAAQNGGGGSLPRTGAPVLLFAVAGYGLLLAGIAIRRTA